MHYSLRMSWGIREIPPLTGAYLIVFFHAGWQVCSTFLSSTTLFCLALSSFFPSSASSYFDFYVLFVWFPLVVCVKC